MNAETDATHLSLEQPANTEKPEHEVAANA
jgi:hypothetical protein